ncbi:hypothetical protein LSCM1_07371 [Leishmania martiniquensis]|uniref:Uncharacterized protein n=1 Tax=Leishmania martiniquensis TaxID=1580590 RepID=A0A836L2A7_9TRYP|nr:hypothetical protein LSCM1_07371 [Leishmania martiniquensis]
MRSTAAASPSAEQAAHLQAIEQQLQAMRIEQGRYRRYCHALEGVCWDLLDDLGVTGKGGSGVHGEARKERLPAADGTAVNLPSSTPPPIPPAATPHASSGMRGLDRPSSHPRAGSHTILSPCTEVTPSMASSNQTRGQPHLCTPLPLSQLDAASTPGLKRGAPRSCKAGLLSPHETQLLFNRLRQLRQWMSDLVTGVSAATFSARAEDGCRVGGTLSSPSVAPAEVVTDACVCGDASTSSSAPPLSPGEPSQELVTARRLHRAVDDLFMLFTQLQATLTDTVWCTSHPPALSTPARTNQDRDVEVERLRAINQQLRRILRGYEQSHKAIKGSSTFQACDNGKASRGSAASLPSTPPPGYTASNEPGLFIALRRR